MTFRKMQGEGRERGESQNFDRFCGWFQMVFGERVGKSFGRLWTFTRTASNSLSFHDM